MTLFLPLKNKLGFQKNFKIFNMFSSNNNNININPFPQLPFPSSSSTSFQAPFTDAEAAGFFPAFHNHDPGQLLAGYLVPAGGNYHTHAPNPQQGLVGNMGAWPELGGGKNRSGGDGKKPVRKDRHSKISTSQGLRDRRVRLSIGISREFFDLQDMLGFDTASKTLEWLLGKSKKDIQELEEQLKNRRADANNNNNSSSDEDEEGVKKARASEKDVFARESRAKARERARERTREKMSTSSPTTTPIKCLPDHHHHHNRHRNQESNLYGLTQAGSHNMGSFSRVDHNRSAEEAFVIQRKLMSSKGFVDWDFSNAIGRSTICSTSLSTELQMYGNP